MIIKVKYSYLLSIFFLFVCIGTRPYMNELIAELEGKADPVRQLVVILFLFVGLYLCLKYKASTINTVLFNWPFIVLIVFCCVTLFWSSEASFTFKRLVILISVIVFVVSISSTLSLSKVLEILRFNTLLLLCINFLSIVFLYGLSVDHEGLWKGIHIHKNTAGSISALTTILWYFSTYRHKNLIVVLSLFFLFQTGSKTSFALVFLSIFAAVLFKYIINSRKLTRQTIFVTFLSFIIITTLFFDLLIIVGSLYGDVTLTGRTIIWDFVQYQINLKPNLGYGYQAFWGTGEGSIPLVFGNEFVQQFAQSHNGYIDVIVQLGYLGLTLLIIFLLNIAQSINLACGIINSKQIQLVISLYLYVLLHNFLESSFLSPLSPLFFTFLIVVVSFTREISLERAKVQYHHSNI